MFKRARHQAVADILGRLDAELLAETDCYFGGGTAIVLLLDEYRESADIDFLCASETGYRRIRELVFGGRLDRLFIENSNILQLRELRADQYGVRTWLGIRETKIKFEIIREGRVDLSGCVNETLGVPVLSRADMYCEKLLANADRFADRSVLSRDIIDLAMMIARWGPIPPAALDKAQLAYGSAIEAALEKAVVLIRQPDWLRACMSGMAMDETVTPEILRAVEGFDSRS